MICVVKAYAKLNLFLDITGKRADGFHELNSVMQLIDFYDTVTVRLSEGNGIIVRCDDSAIPTDERNIAYRAAALFIKAYAKPLRVSIDIQKRIFTEGGLGGSSTDGAAVLRGMNELLGYPLTSARIHSLAEELGADVPFCVFGVNSPTMLCTGKGCDMKPLKPLTDCCFLIVKPDFSCNTKQAYALYDRKPIKPADNFGVMCEAVENGALGGICENMYNAFDVLYSDENILNIKKELCEKGALQAALSGSGSCVFGVFKDEMSADKALREINYPRKIVVKPHKNT